MTGNSLGVRSSSQKLPRIELRMLSFDLEERADIARFLTDDGYSVRNESAANIERLERRLIDDEWELIFIDARSELENIAKTVELIRSYAANVPIFGIVESGQANHHQLLNMGFVDLFSPGELNRMPSSVSREFGAVADRELATEARRLQDEIKVVGDERTVLAEIGRLVSSSLDIGQVYEELIDQVKQLIPLDTAAIAVADVATNTVTFEHVTGDPLPGFGQGTVIAMSDFTDADQLARFVFVLDTELLSEMKTEYPGIEDLIKAGVRSAMSTPLIHRDEVVGMLATTSSVENAYGPEHVEAAERVAAQISGALANSRLHSRITRIAQVRETLVQITRNANNALELKSLFEGLDSQLQELFPFERIAIALTTPDPETLALAFSRGVEVEGQATGDTITITDLADAVLSESRLISLADYESSQVTELERTTLGENDLKSNMRSPLRARDSVIGFISVSAVQEDKYTTGDLALLERVADQISPVIESLRLLEQVQSLAATVETTLDLVAICDLSGVTSYLNPAGIKILGIEESASGIGVDIKQFISDDVVEVIRNTGLKQAEVMGGWQAEISLTVGDPGYTVPVEIQLVPVRNANNEMTSVNVFMRDLREREAVQIERREFVSTVTHELRTPLTSMKMYTDMLGEGDAGELTDQQQRLVNNMKSTVDRLSRMVDDLNVVSMLEAGRFSLQIESFDIVELVSSAIDLTEPYFAERGITVSSELEDQTVVVDADRERMLQVLVNLLTNTSKYADENTVTTVSVTTSETEVEVAVSDQGQGIDPDELEAVFESFYRSKSARRSRVAGSGLGLSIARGFVEAQGGRIWAESVVGEGSRFIFTLPLVIT